MEQAIKCLHVCYGLPTNATWLKAIRLGNYTTLPVLTIKPTNKYFPGAEETQKGHMRQTRQGVIPTTEKHRSYN